MKFSWPRSLYFAARFGFMAFAVGLILGFLFVVVAGQGRELAGLPGGLFIIAFFLSLAWDLFTKEPPDA